MIETLPEFGLSADTVLAPFHLPRLPQSPRRRRENPMLSLLHEEEIEPAQIGEYKAEVHRRFLSPWAADASVSPEAAWEARDECIRMLERRSASSAPVASR